MIRLMAYGIGKKMSSQKKRRSREIKNDYLLLLVLLSALEGFDRSKDRKAALHLPMVSENVPMITNYQLEFVKALPVICHLCQKALKLGDKVMGACEFNEEGDLVAFIRECLECHQ
jgi:hypothetical protein